MATIDSVLDSTKFNLGIQPTDLTFDTALIIDINAVLMVLNQLGITSDVLSISDNTTTWADLFPTGDDAYFAALKPYVHLKVQAMFDPSSSGVVNNSINSLISELETRLTIHSETREVI
ncbi:hypothetical protein E2P63_05325 [Candidatus Bathyarchaeota archaeon]|nr:hypothetical protein E2P63_05325 [Candidatus Bathyarchaeota archaeon]